MRYIVSEGSRGCAPSVQSAEKNVRINCTLRGCLRWDLVLEVDPQVPSITEKTLVRCTIVKNISSVYPTHI